MPCERVVQLPEAREPTPGKRGGAVEAEGISG